jgi:Tfp pilus assembly protein PilF
LADAEPLLIAALARNPDDLDCLRALALGRITKGDPAEATELLERWRALLPDDPEPLLAIVDQAMKLNRPAEAIEPARAALALRPQLDSLRERLIFWLFLTGQTEEADVECRRCRERKDTLALKLLNAEIARRLGDNAMAERLTDDVLAGGLRTASALSLRGALALEAGDLTQALSLLKEAVAKGGDGQTRARHFLSLAYARNGDEENAKRVLAEELQQQSMVAWEKYGRMDGVGYLVVIAEGLFATGKPDEALSLVRQALSKNPNCRAAHKLMADYYDRKGQSTLATEHRRKAIE